ncbi:MAG: hypothetical protein JW772_02665 [Candidatus Diapherotrites archaeon]|nr:hypothetical protein [Candidatus Diapherotrites archaeon]
MPFREWFRRKKPKAEKQTQGNRVPQETAKRQPKKVKPHEFFERLPVTSTSFMGACKKAGLAGMEAHTFAQMYSAAKTSPEPIWVKAREAFKKAQGIIAKEKLTTAERLKRERRALEGIFAQVLPKTNIGRPATGETPDAIDDVLDEWARQEKED